MSFDISEYKLKHIVSLEDGLIGYERLGVSIEDGRYTYKIDNVQSEIIELVDYYQYREIKLSNGPIEKILKGFTYGKSYRELNDHEIYEIRFSKFNAKIEGKTYEFQITGAGPTAIKVSLFLRYDEIDKEETSLERDLKDKILKKYEDKILNNSNYQEKLKQLKKEDDEYQSKMNDLDEEIRREQEEKERKWRELEARLNSNK